MWKISIVQKLLLLCIKSLREHPDIDRFPSKRLIKKTMLPSAGHWPCDLGTGLDEIMRVKSIIILIHIELHIQHGFQRAPGAGAHPGERCTWILDESKSSHFGFYRYCWRNPWRIIIILNKALLVTIKESRLWSKFISIAAQWTTCFATWASESRDL